MSDARLIPEGVSVHVEKHEGGVPAHAPLAGRREVLVGVAHRLDHEINHAPRDVPSDA